MYVPFEHLSIWEELVVLSVSIYLWGTMFEVPSIIVVEYLTI